ncbi:MAG: isopentenyl-diphosphate Delta-isomerase [Bacteroidetes bacterium]|nr:isopentenyl-diphosphate Delta-isomerase [Bacteroidota bacterium]
MTEEKLILVDELDNEIGVCEKIEAHQKKLLHRAFSIFVFNDKKELLLQRRAVTKYHSAGLWTNTCCGHPRPNETTINAATRRLQEEMGFVCSLQRSFSFIYDAKLENNLFEYEYDHVFIGTYNDAPVINTEEASEWKYESLELVKQDVLRYPQNYTVWFKKCLDRIVI